MIYVQYDFSAYKTTLTVSIQPKLYIGTLGITYYTTIKWSILKAQLDA